MLSMKKCLMAVCVAFSVCAFSPVQAKTIVVAADATWPPFELVDENKQVTGYAIDYIKAVAKAAGYEADVRNTAWDGIFAALGAKQCDVIASSVTITEQRQKSMAFTTPYFENYQALIVKADSDIKTFADLKGKTAGGQIGTTGMLFLPELSPGATAKTYDEVGLAIEDLRNGRIDAVVCDEFVAYFFAEQNEAYLQQFKIVDKSVEAELYGFAVRKGDTELLENLNKGIEAVKASGLEAELIAKWLR